MAVVEREDGFYWIRLHGKWIVAHYIRGRWGFPGGSCDYGDSICCEIDERRVTREQ